LEIQSYQISEFQNLEYLLYLVLTSSRDPI
jgi:hypothetical protein